MPDPNASNRPWKAVAIADCGEPLVPIPTPEFAHTLPHPYQVLGAPYGPGVTPFSVRAGVLSALRSAQQNLQHVCPGWQLKVFDAYRPVAVQQFMVDYTFSELVSEAGQDPGTLSQNARQEWLGKVYEFWSPPSANPSDAPPHSTGGAIDVTLVDTGDRDVAFGSPVDEVSERSYPDHFAQHSGTAERTYHQHRLYLRDCMVAAGFAPHPREWWHFSLGDRMWAWQQHQQDSAISPIARYGRADLL